MHAVFAGAVRQLHRSGIEACFEIIEQRQTFADIGQRHLIAAMPARRTVARIGQVDLQLVAVTRETDTYVSILTRRLYPVLHGVLEQRLQHQRRHLYVVRHVDDLPLDVEPVAEAQLLEVEILAAERDLVGERHKVAVIAH